MGFVMDIRKIVGKRTMVFVHSVAYMFNEKGEVLLQKRSDDGRWSHNGGSIEIDETAEDCAKREIFEETGLIIDELVLFNVTSGKKYHHTYPNGDDLSPVDIEYIATKWHGELRTSEETPELRWFSEDNLPPLTSRDEERIRNAFAKYKAIKEQ
ncbi:MAG: NUDIX domain-containing protein [Bacilli bacterium]|nr:NUDIX domain-containing protein [Bacilli bacterium]